MHHYQCRLSRNNCQQTISECRNRYDFFCYLRETTTVLYPMRRESSVFGVKKFNTNNLVSRIANNTAYPIESVRLDQAFLLEHSEVYIAEFYLLSRIESFQFFLNHIKACLNISDLLLCRLYHFFRNESKRQLILSIF